MVIEGILALLPKYPGTENDPVHRVEDALRHLARYLDGQAAWTEEDQELPEDNEIRDAHPLRTGYHDQYVEAMRLVGAKHSKYALVDLVNWLLYRLSEAEG
jgi:hypothetical protein